MTLKISKQHAAIIRKYQAHPRYRTRNLRREAMVFESQLALRGFIYMLEDGLKAVPIVKRNVQPPMRVKDGA
jgi:hypothetical protein